MEKEIKMYQDTETGLWGLKDEAGKIILKPTYYRIAYDGTFQREEDGLWGFWI